MNQILIDSAKYRLLRENSLLSDYIKLAKENEEAALSVVKNIQSECKHEKCIEMRGNRLAGSWEKGPLESKHCVDCGFVITKPKASEYKVCIICWGSMKDLGHERQGEDRVHVYQCSLCRHKEEHT